MIAVFLAALQTCVTLLVTYLGVAVVVRLSGRAGRVSYRAKWWTPRLDRRGRRRYMLVEYAKIAAALSAVLVLVSAPVALMVGAFSLVFS